MFGDLTDLQTRRAGLSASAELLYLFAGRIRKNYLGLTEFHKIRWKGGTWATEETVRFW